MINLISKLFSFFRKLLRFIGIKNDYKNLADEIGRVLHEQIYGALKENEDLASKRINTPFFTGYYACFVQMSFVQAGAKSTEAEDYYEYICNGVMPKRLWKIFNTQLTILENSKGVSKFKEFEDEFELGAEAGMWDGSNLFSWSDKKISRTNLRLYLLNKKLNFKKIK